MSETHQNEKGTIRVTYEPMPWRERLTPCRYCLGGRWTLVRPWTWPEALWRAFRCLD